MNTRRTSKFASLAGSLALGMVMVTAGAGPAYGQEDGPTTPDNLRAEVGTSSVTVQWDPSQSDVGVTIYYVKLDGRWFFTEEPIITFHLAQNQTYQVEVQAQDAGWRRSDWSDPFQFTTPNEFPVTTPGDVQVSESPGSLSVQWDAASSDAGVLDYTATVRGGPDGTVARRTTGTSATFPIPPGGEVDVTVTARDRAYRLSDSSDPVEATVPADPDWDPPEAPTNLRAVFDSQGWVQRVEWDAAEGGADPLTYHLLLDGSEIERTQDLEVEVFAFARCPEGAPNPMTFTVMATSEGFESGESNPITLCFD